MRMLLRKTNNLALGFTDMSFFARLFGPHKPAKEPLLPLSVIPMTPLHASEPASKPTVDKVPGRLIVDPPRKSFRVPPELRSAMMDADGQPHPSFNSWRRNDRAIHELLGGAKGILAGGVVLPEEVISLSRWVLANAEPDSGWPIDVVCHRLSAILADGQIDPEECEDLAHLLRELVAAGVSVPAGYNAATKLPFTEPPPTPLEFSGSLFVLTGKFYYGPRARCQRAI